MITLNGKRFARNNAEFVASLFDPKGSCSGTYKRNEKSVTLFDPQGKKIAVINRHGVLCRADILPNGRTWYSLATVAIIGRWDSYMRGVDECAAALRGDMVTP
jgi:hypothetical protein